MSLGGVLISHMDNRFLHLRRYPVLHTRLPTTLLPQTLETLLFVGRLDVIKVLSGYAADLRGLRDGLERLSEL